MVTLQQYRKLVADHPRKFDGPEIEFSPKGEPGYECHACFHFYDGNVAKRSVCEIYRGAEGGSVPSEGGCRFWTRDGKRHPLFQRTSPPPKRKEKDDAKDQE